MMSTSAGSLSFCVEPYGLTGGEPLARGEKRNSVLYPTTHYGTPRIEEVFATIFAKAKYLCTASQYDMHVHIEVFTRPHSRAAMSRALFFRMTLGALPWYSGQSGYTVNYHLYRDGTLKQIYRYEITRKVFMWLPLFLFIWINAIMDDQSDAFETSTRQFLADAARDGHLQLSAAGHD